MLSNCEIKIAFHVRKHEMWSIRIFKHVLLLHRLKKKWITTKHFPVLCILLRVLCYARAFVRIVRGKKKKSRNMSKSHLHWMCCLFLLSFSFIIHHISLIWMRHIFHWQFWVFFWSTKCKGEEPILSLFASLIWKYKMFRKSC